MQYFKSTIFGYRTIIHTDSKNLTYLKSCEKSRTNRWKLLLSEFNIEFKHIDGTKNVQQTTLAEYII